METMIEDSFMRTGWRERLPCFVLATVCALGVMLCRTTSASVILVGDFRFAYSDIFIILASAIGGMGCGLIAFAELFVSEMCKLHGDFIGLYALVTYLSLVPLSARLAYQGAFCTKKKYLPLCAVLLSLLLAFFWFLTFTVMKDTVLEENRFRELSFFIHFIDALPECSISTVLIALYFRFASDNLKLKLGSGWLYTAQYCTCTRQKYILGAKITAISLGEAFCITIAAIIFSDVQMAISQGWTIHIHCVLMLWRQNLQLGMMLVCIAVPVAYLFNRYVLKYVVTPINAMSVIAGKYFEGEKTVSFPDLDIHTGDEIEQLYKSLRKMTRDMEGYLDMWEKQAKLESELKIAAEASKAKSDFLSSMSHEIRTPINAVLGLDEMILREADDDVIQGYARDIQSSSRMLLAIINDILDFSKIEAGKMEIIPADYDLSALVADLVNMISARAEKKGLALIVHVDENTPHLLTGDDTRLKQCILNILTNAVKYTRTGSVTLDISAEKTAENRIALTVRVTDTGIGIKAEDLEKLYMPFQRIEEKRNRGIEGTGLGMSIVQSLLSAMESRLEVKSVYGEGSTFGFTVAQDVRSWEAIGDWRATKEKCASAAGRYTESFQAPAAHILVIDDTPMNLTVITALLKATRIQIDTAGSAADALTMAHDKPYHLIFADHLMPKMDGIEFLHALRADATSANNATACIALTANAVSGAREMYLREGFAGYLSKPVESVALEELLSRNLPEKLVLHKGDAGYAEIGTWDGKERRKHGNSASDALLGEVFKLNIAEALKNCGTLDTFKSTLCVFTDSIDDNAAEIETALNAHDWDTFTIKVHALKSSARLIGATGLSEKARALEAAGNALRLANAAENVEAIICDTEKMLSQYREYAARLFPLAKPNAIDADFAAHVEKVAPKKLPIADEKLIDALRALKEVVSVADFDTADAIIAELSEYEPSEEYRALFSAVAKAVKNVDAAAVASLLSQI